jgi:hypothetical protein
VNWLLLLVPALGVIGIVAALPLVRKFAPLERAHVHQGNIAYPAKAGRL